MSRLYSDQIHSDNFQTSKWFLFQPTMSLQARLKDSEIKKIIIHEIVYERT